LSEPLISPAVVWGLIPRFIGVLYVIAFGSLIPQLTLLIGSEGLGPINLRLARARQDFPGLRRFLDFPTLLWISDSDRTLRVIPWLGVGLGMVCAYGGPLAPWAHGLCVLLWLSLEPAMLIFPWDTMLQEAGFLTLFLPSVRPLPAFEAVSEPYPAAAFMLRFLVLRLMLGFGKIKFVGSRLKDALYLRGFFVWSAPTPLGLIAHQLPAFVLRALLGFMFAAEVIAPVLGFFSGAPRLISCAMLVSLMIGIHLTGNWGYFNVGYLLLCLCLLDTQSSIFDLAREPWASTLWEWPQLPLNALLALLFVIGLLYLVASESWTTRTMVKWPLDAFTWNRAWLRGSIAFLRLLSPLRLVNGYGVFPPHSPPPMFQMPVFEGSDDGVTWKAYRFRWMPSSAEERPRFCAPLHPRLDLGSTYSVHAIHDACLFGSLFGDGSPYGSYVVSSWLERLCQLLLEDSPTGKRLLGDNPFPDAPPKFMRVAMDALTAAAPEVRRATGRWWHVRRCGLLLMPHGKQSWSREVGAPRPEVFHPDWVDFKRRSAPLRALTAAFQRGEAPDSAVLTHSDLAPEDVRAFWTEFVPCVNRYRGDFEKHVEAAAELESRFGKLQIARFERVLERFAWLLRLRTERHQYADARPKLPIETNFRYHMFLHELVMDGREAYRSYLADAARVVARLEHSSDARQLWTLTMLRHSSMLMHIAAFRWTDIGKESHQLGVPGLFEYYPLLAAAPLPEEQWRPLVVLHPNGEHSIEGFYPPPRLAQPAAGGPTATCSTTSSP
jgi:Lipase maturation factor